MKNDYIFQLTGVTIFLLLKVSYISISIKDLIFILGPTDYLISIITDSESNFIKDIGYYHADLNITIEKACSGFNFMLISFLTTYYLCINHFKKQRLKLMMIPISVFFAWFLTIAVNTSRILFSVWTNRWTFFPNAYKGIIHQVEGTIFYLSFLVLTYLLINHLLIKYTPKNEKPA